MFRFMLALFAVLMLVLPASACDPVASVQYAPYGYGYSLVTPQVVPLAVQGYTVAPTFLPAAAVTNYAAPYAVQPLAVAPLAFSSYGYSSVSPFVVRQRAFFGHGFIDRGFRVRFR